MYCPNINPDNVMAFVEQFELKEKESLMLLFGEHNDTDYEQLIAVLNEHNIPFFGGFFPGIIYGVNNYTKGCIMKKMPLAHQPVLIHGLENEEFTIPDLPWLNSEKEADNLSMLTFVDGLSSNIGAYLTKLYYKCGNRVRFIGGGAGSLSLEQKPCIFTNEGIFQNAAVLCPVMMDVSLGVKHGWKKMMGPLVATRTNKNVIYELNWTNAFELYKKAIMEDANVVIDSVNFFDVAKSYPFGIFKENREDIVRDPIAVGLNGELICVGEVPENTVLYILKGESEALISSAQMAIDECLAKTSEPIAHTLLIDCISRSLFLEDKFTKELEAVNDFIQPANDEAIPQGVLSLGEISSDGDGFLEFYNKTLVVGVLSNWPK